jgi:hypothetical protein
MVVPDVSYFFTPSGCGLGRRQYFVVTPFGFAQGFTTAFGRAVGASGARFFRGAKAPRLIPKSKDNDKSSRKHGQRQELPKASTTEKLLG